MIFAQAVDGQRTYQCFSGGFEFSARHENTASLTGQLSGVHDRIGHVGGILLLNIFHQHGCCGTGVNIDEIIRFDQQGCVPADALFLQGVDRGLFIHGQFADQHAAFQGGRPSVDLSQFSGLCQFCQIPAERRGGSPNFVLQLCNGNGLPLFQQGKDGFPAFFCQHGFKAF